MPSYYFDPFPHFLLSNYTQLSIAHLPDDPTPFLTCQFGFQFPPLVIVLPVFCSEVSGLQFESERFEVSPLVGKAFPFYTFHSCNFLYFVLILCTVSHFMLHHSRCLTLVLFVVPACCKGYADDVIITRLFYNTPAYVGGVILIQLDRSFILM